MICDLVLRNQSLLVTVLWLRAVPLIPSLSLSFCLSPVSLVLSLIVHCALLLIEGLGFPLKCLQHRAL